MPPDATNPARGGAAGSGRHHHKRLASEVPGFKLPAPTAQALSRLQRSLPRSAFPRRRLQGLARELHRLGPKALFRYLDEVERGAPVAATLESFVALLSDEDAS